MDINIIGISAHFHDSSCCLLQNGKLVAAAQEERFSRLKHDPSIPKAAFNFCLNQGGITMADIDCIAYYEDPVKKLQRQLWSGLPHVPPNRAEWLFKLDPGRPESEIRELLGFHGRIEYVDHHDSHGASAFLFSGFEDAAIFTVDGVGEWATTTYGYGKGSETKIVEEVLFPHSLGLLYSMITGYLGFEVNEGEYKVMGLAPYGEPNYVDQIRQLVVPAEKGQFRLSMDYFDFVNPTRMYSPKLIELLGNPPRSPESEISKFVKDVAKSLQIVLQEILLAKVNYLYSLYPSENLCMAGGVALNCVANGMLRRKGPFKHMFVQPAAGDAGGALGAAAIAHVRLTGQRPADCTMRHVFLGPDYPASVIAKMFSDSPARPLDFRQNEVELLQAVVQRLASGKVIGWFHGRMEFGPRSLGARSILADPRGEEMRDRINALVKKREAFRPFAPAVLVTKAPNHFDLNYPSPFMLETCQVTSSLELPAITHLDNSARVQTVDAETNPRLFRLLEEFESKTGCPILLNTSFNVRGEPIVCSPHDALLCFLRSDIDCLVLEDFILDREAVPSEWIAWHRSTGPQFQPQISQSVYTLF